MRSIGEDYGSVVRVRTVMNVSLVRLIMQITHGLSLRYQKDLLFVFDPKALQSIVLTDSHLYEEPTALLQYVSSEPFITLFESLNTFIGAII